VSCARRRQNAFGPLGAAPVGFGDGASDGTLRLSRRLSWPRLFEEMVHGECTEVTSSVTALF